MIRFLAGFIFGLVVGFSFGDAGASMIPREARALKREFVAVNRQIWGPENPAFLAAQVDAESGWVDGLTSSAKARGICQFIEGTAAGAEKKWQSDLAGLARYSPRWCLRAQSRLMKEEYDRWIVGRGQCSAILFSASAYNGGPSRLAAETFLCADDEDCAADRWFGNVARKKARAQWAIDENRAYVMRIFQSEPSYADDGFGILFCL